ncbi:hypothetical protein SCOCK_30421 [Actinacidiphila cocklensis]|uniref:Uncharacterized protein n=1 Tax=Actinacidiphila cocklensis TaxID=887465 RepID=A0A9W4DX92_9ACTN|nr:hypothetical protein SCOCK_30421 [Actinacidiphila cocklensis]
MGLGVAEDGDRDVGLEHRLRAALLVRAEDVVLLLRRRLGGTLQDGPERRSLREGDRRRHLRRDLRPLRSLGLALRGSLRRLRGLHLTLRGLRLVLRDLLHLTLRSLRLVLRDLLHLALRSLRLVLRSLLHLTLRSLRLVLRSLLHLTLRSLHLALGSLRLVLRSLHLALGSDFRALRSHLTLRGGSRGVREADAGAEGGEPADRHGHDGQLLELAHSVFGPSVQERKVYYPP